MSEALEVLIEVFDGSDPNDAVYVELDVFREGRYLHEDDKYGLAKALVEALDVWQVEIAVGGEVVARALHPDRLPPPHLGRRGAPAALQTSGELSAEQLAEYRRTFNAEPWEPSVEQVIEYLRQQVCSLDEPHAGPEYHDDHGHTHCLFLGWAIELLSETERLRAWKAEALVVLGEWEAVWQAAGRPGQLGSSKARSVRALFEPCEVCKGRGRVEWNLTDPDSLLGWVPCPACSPSDV